MAKVGFSTPQVSVAAGTATVYNWSAIDVTLGDYDIGSVWQDAPGVGPGSGINTITTSIAPRPVFQPVLGQIIRAWDPLLGFGEFILLQVATVTAVPLGTVVTWMTGALGNYVVAVVPTTAKSAAPVAVCVANTTAQTGNVTTTGTGILSKTPVQYAWFQITGIAQVLTTAVIRTTNSKVFVSGTAGRLMVTSASGTNVIGARTANSNSATISCNLVWFDRANVMGNIT